MEWTASAIGGADGEVCSSRGRYASLETISRRHLMTTCRLPKSCAGGHGTLCGGVQSYEVARDLARKKLTAVAEGEDPSADRHAVRAGMSVCEVCDWYIEQAEEGRILGRNRRPIKASTLHMDRSRIETHIKPLLGSRLVSGLTPHDIEGMQADIAAGKSARGRKKGRGGRSTGGAGVASRTIGTLRSLLGHAARLNIIGRNPADGVQQLAGEKRQRRLSDDELRLFGQVVREAAVGGEDPTGLGAVRLMLLTGFRRMEVLGLERLWYGRKEHCIRFPDTKCGAQIRVLGGAAMVCIEFLPVRDVSPVVFPADWGEGHLTGVVRVLNRICLKARLKG